MREDAAAAEETKATPAARNMVQISNPAFVAESAFARFNKSPQQPHVNIDSIPALKFDKIQQLLAAEATVAANNRTPAPVKEEFGTPQLAFKDIDAMLTPIGGFVQNPSPFPMRKISASPGYASVLAWKAYGMPPPIFQSQTSSPAYIPGKSPIGLQQQATGYVDFSAAIQNDNYLSPMSGLPGTSSARVLPGYMSALSPFGYAAKK